MRDSGIFYLPGPGCRLSGYFHREFDSIIDVEHNMDRGPDEISDIIISKSQDLGLGFKITLITCVSVYEII